MMDLSKFEIAGPVARRVVIATPAHDRKTHADFTHAYGETIRLGCQMGIDIKGLFWPGEAIVQIARAELVREALAANVSDLVWIDSDVAWKPEWVMRLLRHPVDCVGAALVKKQDAEAYAVSIKLPVARCPNSGLLEMPIGTGFLRMSRRALQTLWDNSPEYRDDWGKVNRWMFPIQPVNGRVVGEDIGACLRLAALGIKTYADPAMTCDHVGTKVWHGDFAAWLAKLERTHAEQTRSA